MQKIHRLFFLPLLCLILIALGAPAQAADTIKIGIIGPMNFIQGKGLWNGAEMAVEELNAQGGINVGRQKMKIELVKADSNEFFSIPDAASAMEKLILRDKVDFVLGGFRSEAVLAMQDVAMDNKKLFFGLGAAHPELCLRVAKDYNRYKYFFRRAPFNSNYLIRNVFAQVRSVTTELKKKLAIDRVRVAIVAEKAMWVEDMVKTSESFLPKMGMEVAGVWRPASTAKDVTAELTAIQREGVHMILTIISGPVGIPLARQAGEMKVPAVQVGINVEAAKSNFAEVTQGNCNYIMTQTTYCGGAEQNELTAPFVNNYMQRYGGDNPPYTADSYSVIKYDLPNAIEKSGSLSAETLIPILEMQNIKVPAGWARYERDEQGRHLHDVMYGPGINTSLGVQWQDGKMVAVWPHFKWMSPYWEYSVEPPDKPNELSYKGLKPYIIAPWVASAYKK
jgi:branched-chain amino acid transport system substrate-binding protein